MSIFLTKPDDFNSKFEIVSCFIECNDRILLLHRNDNKPQGNTWGVPAGKVEQNEDLINSLKREIFEETGLIIETNNLNFFKTLYVKYSDFDFIYYMYNTKIDNEVSVILNNSEHKDFTWLKPFDALKLNLIPDEDECIKLFYDLK